MGPKLDPRPLAILGGGDATRGGCVSRLAARRCEFDNGIFFGSAGTGGASSALGTCGDGCGDGSRNVRSDIEPALPLRSSVDPGGPLTDPRVELPTEEVEPALRSIRFVCTSATDVGVVGRDRIAALAAADAREAFDIWFFKKAWAAAVAAFGFALLRLSGGYVNNQSAQSLCECALLQGKKGL